MPVPYVRTDAQSFVETVVPAGWAARSPTWAIRQSEEGELVGMLGLHEIDELSAEIGFWLAPARRSAGLMTAAVRLACDFAFTSHGMGLQRVEWRGFVGNRASAVVAQRTGFRYEGLLRMASLQRGRMRDTWIAGRLHTDPPGPADGWPTDIVPG